MSSLSMREYHIAFGIHSNIPICCILWWLDNYHGVRFLEKNREHVKKYREVFSDSIGYIPCPVCVEKKECNIIHKCSGEICEDLYKILYQYVKE